jgi:hypothetical protein
MHRYRRGKVEAVKGLNVQGRTPPDPIGGHPAPGDHVRRHVNAIDVTGAHPWHEQTAGSGHAHEVVPGD